MLKCKQVGEAVTLLVSRTERTEEEEADEEEEEKDGDGKSCPKRELEQELAQQMAEGQQLLRLEIPLNETPGAGLGISVKAQRKAGTDSGLYIRSVSAEWRDGCVNAFLEDPPRLGRLQRWPTANQRQAGGH
jgi:hypothetical protein